MGQTSLGAAFSTGWYPESLIGAIDDSTRDRRSGLPYNYRHMLLAGAILHRMHGGVAYARAQNLRRRLRRDYMAALRRAHLLIMPTVRALPPRVRTATGEEERVMNILSPSGDGVSMEQFVGNTCAHNLTGLPALTVPCGYAGGLPVGCQIIGNPGDDLLVLQAGRYLEKALALPDPLVARQSDRHRRSAEHDDAPGAHAASA